MYNSTYNLTVTSSSTQPRSFLVHKQHFLFDISSDYEDAPPCEVYNFSVTATYVGTTYTGAGCSVPSSKISKVLPSLPNPTTLKSSLNYTLEKETTGEIFLNLIIVSSYLYILCSPNFTNY